MVNNLAMKFMNLRQERKLSLRDAAGDITTAATLSRFERGSTQLSANTFIELLDSLHFDWSLFAEPSSNLVMPLTIRIDNAVERRSVQQLKDLEEQMQPATNKVLTLTCVLYRATFGDTVAQLSERVDQAVDIIVKTENWTPIIFRLVGATVFFVEPSLLNELRRMTLSQINRNVSEQETGQRVLAYNIFYWIAVRHLNQGDYAACQKLLETVFEMEHTLFTMPWHTRFIIIQEICKQKLGEEVDPSLIQDIFEVLAEFQNDYFAKGLKADLSKFLK